MQNTFTGLWLDAVINGCSRAAQEPVFSSNEGASSPLNPPVCASLNSLSSQRSRSSAAGPASPGRCPGKSLMAGRSLREGQPRDVLLCPLWREAGGDMSGVSRSSCGLGMLSPVKTVNVPPLRFERFGS